MSLSVVAPAQSLRRGVRRFDAGVRTEASAHGVYALPFVKSGRTQVFICACVQFVIASQSVAPFRERSCYSMAFRLSFMSIFSILGRSAIVTRKVNRYATGNAASHINQLTSETVPPPMAVYSSFISTAPTG